VREERRFGDLEERLRGGVAEIRYAGLKDLSDPDQIRRIEDLLVAICLEDPWGPNRSEAARALGTLWPASSVRKAYEACLQAEPYVANSVLGILGEKMDAAAVCFLGGQFAEAENARLRYSILQSFCGAPEPVMQAFVLESGACEDEDERVRALGVSLLSRANNGTLKSLFLARLKDESQRVRAGAVEALSGICGPLELLELLPPYLEDSSNRVQANALVPLLKAGSLSAWHKLCEMVNHTCGIFRSSAAYVLGELIPTPSVTLHLSSLAKDRDPAVRTRALASAQRLSLTLPQEG